MNATFGATSTVGELLQGRDLGDVRVLVTGVSAGVGLQIARALSGAGAEVVGTARDLDKARSALERAGVDAAPSGPVRLQPLDLASLQNVRACADSLLARGEPFDLVIANAGVMALPEGRTPDGFETQFATNYLGHFLLLNRLAWLLRPVGAGSSPSRPRVTERPTSTWMTPASTVRPTTRSWRIAGPRQP